MKTNTTNGIAKGDGSFIRGAKSQIERIFWSQIELRRKQQDGEILRVIDEQFPTRLDPLIYSYILAAI